MKSLYESPESKAAIQAIYQEKLDSLKIDYRFQNVPTTFGETNVIITGDSQNPPLILVHGSNGCAPVALDVYPNLSKHFQVFAVDVIAQPNKSAETRPSMKDTSYGDWMHQIISYLDLKQVVLLGFSFGGFIILKTLIEKEERIKAAFIVAPVGIVNGNPFKAIFKVFLPMKRYMWGKKQNHLKQFLGALFSEEDAFAVQFLAKVFLHFDMDFSPIPLIKKQDAAKISKPLYLIAAEKDLIGPGKKMIKRAKAIFSSLEMSLLLEASKHVQGRADNKRVEDLVVKHTAI